MAKIYPFIPELENNDNWRVGTDHNVTLSRVPSTGEFVSLGEDTNGVDAVYQVVAVVHAADRPKDTDAEVYLRRVDFLDVQKNLKTRVPFEIQSDAYPVLEKAAT